MTLTSLIVALSQLQEPGKVKEVYIAHKGISYPIDKLFSPNDKPDVVLLAFKEGSHET